MADPASESWIVIGIGNEYARDDAVGLLVARKLKGRAPASVGIFEHGGEGAALMECWKNTAGVILIDATSSGATSGTIRRLEVASSPLPARQFGRSTHAFGLAEAIELSRSLHELPTRLVVYGIEGRDFSAGAGVTAEVAAAVETVAERVLQEIKSGDAARGGQSRHAGNNRSRDRSPGPQPA
jgi:hydrogenase maturation protease